jgi:hypothetical protein
MKRNEVVIKYAYDLVNSCRSSGGETSCVMSYVISVAWCSSGTPDAILESYYADADTRAIMKAPVFQHADWLQMDRGILTEPEMLARLAKRITR